MYRLLDTLPLYIYYELLHIVTVTTLLTYIIINDGPKQISKHLFVSFLLFSVVFHIHNNHTKLLHTAKHYREKTLMIFTVLVICESSPGYSSIHTYVKVFFPAYMKI